MWRRRRDSDRVLAQQVVAEAEGLLSSRAGAAPGGSGRRLAPWVLVNGLAHCDQAALEAVRSGRGAAGPGGWNATVAYLAVEVLAAADDCESLGFLQRQVLVPLELDLLDHKLPEPTTPKELASLVVGALDEYQTHLHRGGSE